MVGCVGVFVMEKRLVTHSISKVSWLSSINDYEYEDTSNQEGYLWPSKRCHWWYRETQNNYVIGYLVYG
jgi:hypothetical protein